MNRIETEISWFEQGSESGWIGRYEKEWLRFLESEFGELSETEKLCVVFISLFVNAGHVILPLDLSPAEWFQLVAPDEDIPPGLPDQKVDIKILENSAITGKNGELKPLHLEGEKLSIRKYRAYEEKITRWISEKCSTDTDTEFTRDHARLLNELFEEDADEINWQKAAAALSLIKPFLIISGGPGTGKTTTIAKILALHNRLAVRPLSVALAAPTGKAAGRMGEALHRELNRMGLDEAEIARLPKEAKTIHRLLYSFETDGLLPPPQKKQMRYDLVIVDEASMIDLSLMHRLVSVLSEKTRLILLGDKDQLASVEAGSVFADLCKKKENGFSPETAETLSGLGISVPASSQNPLNDSIVYLEKSYRFGPESGIGSLAALVRSDSVSEEDIEPVFSRFEDIGHKPFGFSKADFVELTGGLTQRLEQAAAIKDPAEMTAFWKQNAWLAVLRRGMTGTERLNQIVERNVISSRKFTAEKGWYHGRPVIISKNDYDMGIFNGDLGVCIRDRNGKMWVYIESDPDLKRFTPDRIIHYDPAYFLTVHKSQGSEFDTVNFLLPKNDTPVLTKELIYTAITRARDKFTVYGDTNLLIKGMMRKTIRYTGLGHG